jgi:hypothetical protein
MQISKFPRHSLSDSWALQMKACVATSGNTSFALSHPPSPSLQSKSQSSRVESGGAILWWHQLWISWRHSYLNLQDDSLFHLSFLLEESETRVPPLLIIRLMGWKKPNEFGLQIISRDMNIYECARNCSHEPWGSSLGDSQTNAVSEGSVFPNLTWHKWKLLNSTQGGLPPNKLPSRVCG